MKNNKTFVLLAVFALLGNAAFCADTLTKKAQQLSISKEIVKSVSDTLNTEKNNQQVDPALERVTLKVENLKKAFPNSANSISAVLGQIKEVIDRVNIGGSGEFRSQNMLEPLERLSSTLIKLKKQDPIAFNATVGVIDVKYTTTQGLSSLSGFITLADSFLPSMVEINDQEGLIYAMKADSIADVSNRLTKLGNDFPANKKDIEFIKEQVLYVAYAVNKEFANQSHYGQNLENGLESLENLLRELKAKDSKVFDHVISIINREYVVKKSTASISDLVETVNEIFSGLPATALVRDPQKILISMTAYNPQYR